MGKIQDAIRKVQRSRSGAGSSGLDTLSSTTDNLELMSQDQVADVSPDQSAEEHKWDYRGRDIHVDLQRLIEAGLLDPDHSRKHLANEYRQIKRALLANIMLDGASRIRRSNLIMVGSAKPGEGKSFISLNLSMSLAAESGYTVVLVDSDMGNPQLSELMVAGNEMGLFDLLVDPSLDPTQVISPTDVPGLSMLPTGKTQEQTAELLANEGATKLFDDLSAADPKRIFIFDSPSMLSSTEAPTLGDQVGQIVFVVQAGKTVQRSVLQALDKLDRKRPISIVLNQVID